MISKHRLGWITRISAAALLSLGLVACSDDNPGDGDVDAGGPDACVGHTCTPTAVAGLPEGGTLRLEYVHAGLNGPDRVEGINAFVAQYEGQQSWDENNPDVPRPFLGPSIATSATMECYDQTDFNYFFQGHHPNIQNLADTRTYYADGPATIPLTAVGGPGDGTVFDLVRQENTRDTANFIEHDNVWMGIAQTPGSAAELTRNTKQTINAIPPNGDYPGLVLPQGYDMTLGGAEFDGTIGSFIAPDFDFDMPTPAEFFDPNGLVIDDTADWQMGFTMVDGLTVPGAAEGWPNALWFTGFVSLQDYGNGAGGVPTLNYMCLGPAGSANSNQDIVIPQEVLELAPESGAIIAGIITHTAWALNETHRFDSIGMNCDFTTYSKATAP